MEQVRLGPRTRVVRPSAPYAPGRVSPGQTRTGQGFHVFLATDVTHGTPGREPEEQDMVQAWMPRTDVERRIRNGTITDDSTLAAYTLILLNERVRYSGVAGP